MEKKINKVIKEFDKNNNLIYIKYSNGHEFWYKYDEENRIIHYKDFSDLEEWYKYNEENEKIKITKKEYNLIRRKRNGY